MSREGVTYDQVAQAAATLRADGRKPTVQAVRDWLKHGSNSTIARHLKQWKASDGRGTPPAQTGLAPELLVAVQQLQEQLQKDANATIETVRAEAAQVAQRAKTELDAAQARSEALARELAELRGELTTTQAERTRAQTDLEKAERQVAKLTDQKESLATRLADHQASQRQLNEQLKQAQATLKDERQAAQQAIADLQADLKDARAQADEWKDRARQRERECETAQSQAKDLRVQTERLSAEQETLRRSLEEKADALQESQAERRRLVDVNAELKSQLGARDARLIELERALAVSQDRLNQLAGERDTLKAQYQHAEKDIAQLQRDKARLEGLLERK